VAHRCRAAIKRKRFWPTIARNFIRHFQEARNGAPFPRGREWSGNVFAKKAIGVASVPFLGALALSMRGGLRWAFSRTL
jgi:hypothetical protein